MNSLKSSRVGDPHDDVFSNMLVELSEFGARSLEDYSQERIVPFVIACRTCQMTGKIMTIKGTGLPFHVLGKKLKSFAGTDIERLIDELARPHGQSAEVFADSTVAACLNRFCKPTKPPKYRNPYR